MQHKSFAKSFAKIRAQSRALSSHPFALGLALVSGALIATPAQAAFQVLKTIPLTTTGGFDYLKFDPVSKTVFVALGGAVAIVDPEGGKQIGAITGMGLSGARGVAIDPEGKFAFISNSSANSVSRIDLATKMVTGNAKTGAFPDYMLFDTASGKVFSGNQSGGSVTVIDPATMMVDKTLTFMSGSATEGLVSDGAGKVYANLADSNLIAQIDSKTMTVLNQWPVGAGNTGGTGLAMDPMTRRLFISCSGKLVVMNADTGAVITTVPTGSGADGAAFDADNKLIFTTNGGSGTLSVIRETSADAYMKIEDAKTASGCRTVTFDPIKHQVFSICSAGTPKVLSVLVIGDQAGAGNPDAGASDAATDTGNSGSGGSGGGGASGAGGSPTTGGGGSGTTGAGGSPTGAGGSATTGSGGSSSQTGGISGGSGTGGKITTGSGGGSGNPVAPPSTGSSGGGCQMTGGTNTSSLGALASMLLAALGLISTRRRAQRR